MGNGPRQRCIGTCAESSAVPPRVRTCFHPKSHGMRVRTSQEHSWMMLRVHVHLDRRGRDDMGSVHAENEASSRIQNISRLDKFQDLARGIRHDATMRNGHATLPSVHVHASCSCNCTSSATVRREGSKKHVPFPHARGLDRRHRLSTSPMTFVSIVRSSICFRSFVERAFEQGYVVEKHGRQPTHALHGLSFSNGRVIGRRNECQAFDTFIHAHSSLPSNRSFVSHDTDVPSPLPSRFFIHPSVVADGGSLPADVHRKRRTKSRRNQS